MAVIVVALAFIPANHQSLSWTFFHYENHYGWANPIYVFFIGLLMAQYTYTGFDASAHVSEETHSAATNAPKGIVNSVIVSIFAGWILLVAATTASVSANRARRSECPTIT